MSNYKITIDNNVPIPSAYKNLPKYPLADLQIGQSFWTPGNGVRGSTTSVSCRTGFKFVTRAEVRGEVSGIRVWRVQ